MPLSFRSRHVLILLAALVPWRAALAEFDHAHTAWDALVKQHVRVLPGASSGQVRYAGFKADAPALKTYVENLSRVSEADFGSWTRARQMAFLINAYNALTVAKVLQRYPNLASIRDFGSVIGNPWKDRFFTLFGRDSTLDDIEHNMLRKPGRFDEPRVHYAVNCASVGCPMLREEAYVAERLEAQLAEQEKRFLTDRSRNRFAGGALEVSKIFDWFKADWQSGYTGIGRDAVPIASRERYFARHAKLLADRPDEQQLIIEGRARIRFLDYDWSLNDVR